MLTLTGDYLGAKVLPAKGDWPEGRMVRLDTGEEAFELRCTGSDLISKVDALKRFDPITAEVSLRLARGESSLYRLSLTSVAKKTP